MNLHTNMHRLRLSSGLVLAVSNKKSSRDKINGTVVVWLRSPLSGTVWGGLGGMASLEWVWPCFRRCARRPSLAHPVCLLLLQHHACLVGTMFSTMIKMDPPFGAVSQSPITGFLLHVALFIVSPHSNRTVS